MDYSAIYNKNGRIGIYTRDERRCIIARFHEKKRRRVWKKKIRYHCRKNLADRRVRVKGRFVRASSIDSNAPPDEDDTTEAAMAPAVASSSFSSSSLPSPSAVHHPDVGSPVAVSKKGRLSSTPPTGTMEDGMKAFWNAVTSAGGPPSSPPLPPPAATSMTVAEEVDDDDDDDGQGHTEDLGAPQPTGLGKRFRRYTIAY